METLEILITIKTYPIPSQRYDELVCTAGVTKAGDFVRLYPINFRDLPWDQQYRKYQWIRVQAKRHGGRDSRKESYRPDCETLEVLGEPIPSNPGNWRERSRFALRKRARSMEDLYEQQERDRTSLGLFRPKRVLDLIIEDDERQWKSAFLEELKQSRLFEYRRHTRVPPRKVPFRFKYRFECDDERCRGNHRMMIEDWELGALFWRTVDAGATEKEAASAVRTKFLDDICGPKKDTHFFVGTILRHPKSWVVVGLFYPRVEPERQQTLFDLAD